MDDIKFRITTACHRQNIQNLAHQMAQWLRNNATVSLYVPLALVTTIWATVTLYNRFKSRSAPSRSPRLEKLQPVRTESSTTRFAMETPGGMCTLPVHSKFVDIADAVQSGNPPISPAHLLLPTLTGQSPRPNLSHTARFNPNTSRQWDSPA